VSKLFYSRGKRIVALVLMGTPKYKKSPCWTETFLRVCNLFSNYFQLRELKDFACVMISNDLPATEMLYFLSVSSELTNTKTTVPSGFINAKWSFPPEVFNLNAPG